MLLAEQEFMTLQRVNFFKEKNVFKSRKEIRCTLEEVYLLKDPCNHQKQLELLFIFEPGVSSTSLLVLMSIGFIFFNSLDT